ncbi:hypothetical protein Cenrod_2126 [Candidatus Symbiobacter mobilis CR]|uniref:Uncharacterized protein n=1 Tax=Candidatus Symbiobacter mobilis CR TaxID=946483 RepID=U5N9W1_9BURK|nr:hypothetical protein Cenrod_2126 [Candidatus Symbiobacter mobilis CR]
MWGWHLPPEISTWHCTTPAVARTLEKEAYWDIGWVLRLGMRLGIAACGMGKSRWRAAKNCSLPLERRAQALNFGTRDR